MNQHVEMFLALVTKWMQPKYHLGLFNTLQYEQDCKPGEAELGLRTEQRGRGGMAELRLGREVLRGQAECRAESTTVFFEFIYITLFFAVLMESYLIIIVCYSFIYVLIE